MRNNKIILKILLILIGLGIGFLIIEFMIRVYLNKTIDVLREKVKYIKERKVVNIGAYDKDLGWGFRPKAEDSLLTSDFFVTYKINSQGLRDEEYSYEKKEGIFRIAALGESFTFGEGINFGNRYTEIIEQVLNKVEVINMGVWGFGLDQSILYFKRDGFKFNPDLVIIFVIDDYLQRCKDFIRSSNFKPRFILSENKDSLILQDINFISKVFTKDFSSQIIEHKWEEREKGIFIRSKLFTLLRYYQEIISSKKELEKRDKRYWSSIYKNLKKERLCDYNEEDFKKLIYLLLEDFKKFCINHGFQLLIVNTDTYRIRYLEDICNALEISYLDLSKNLSNASKFKPLRFMIDPHYNEVAHRLIGEYIGEYLKNHYRLELNKNFNPLYLGKF